MIEFPMDDVLELGAVFCAALSGGLSAIRKSFDIFGVLVLAWATGLGGGILRDVLIGATPPVGISSWRLVVAALAAGVVIYFFHPRLERMRRGIIVLDAGALALFVIVGTTKGLDYGVGLMAAVIVGTLTGIGGGVLRDLLTSEAPLILQDRQLYAVPAIVGASITAVLWREGWLTGGTQLATIALIFGFRLVSLRLGWTVPGPWSGRRGGAGSGRM
ncbi:trimeric intracellular cation channel family protein [Oerskovia sp. NPDC056781]|uniref:trimeric intracellular cation channel family protein n=1 Tax=Oerskovia sp. NPDC056781 TaxID=3345942 RepID=UPI00366DE6AD